jgi:hypothetical protein
VVELDCGLAAAESGDELFEGVGRILRMDSDGAQVSGISEAGEEFGRNPLPKSSSAHLRNAFHELCIRGLAHSLPAFGLFCPFRNHSASSPAAHGRFTRGWGVSASGLSLRNGRPQPPQRLERPKVSVVVVRHPRCLTAKEVSARDCLNPSDGHFVRTAEYS